MLRLALASEDCKDDLRGPAGGGGSEEVLESLLPLQCKKYKQNCSIKKAKLLASLCGMCAKLHVFTLYHNAHTTCLGHEAVAVLQ